MSGHRPWREVRDERLSAMTPEERAIALAARERAREELQAELDAEATCGHCGRPITTAARGWAADGTVLCHTGTIPPGNDPPDCFKLCTVYEHAPDGSCCRDQKPPPWKSLRHVPDDFAACSYGSECWRTGVHSLKPRECHYAERPAPEFGYWRTFDPGDGCMSLAMATIPLAAVLPWAEHLAVDQQHQMLGEAADAEDPAAVIKRWKRRAGARAPIQINVQPTPEPGPGYGLGHLRDAYEHGRRQGRHEAGG